MLGKCARVCTCALQPAAGRAYASSCCLYLEQMHHTCDLPDWHMCFDNISHASYRVYLNKHLVAADMHPQSMQAWEILYAMQSGNCESWIALLQA